MWNRDDNDDTCTTITCVSRKKTHWNNHIETIRNPLFSQVRIEHWDRERFSLCHTKQFRRRFLFRIFSLLPCISTNLVSFHFLIYSIRITSMTKCEKCHKNDYSQRDAIGWIFVYVDTVTIGMLCVLYESTIFSLIIVLFSFCFAFNFFWSEFAVDAVQFMVLFE